jgi:hypothetical protein
MAVAMDVLTAAADVVLATETTFEDDPIRGIYMGLAGLSVAAYLIWSGRKWRGFSARELDRHRKSHIGHVPRLPGLNYVAGIAFGVIFLFLLVASCVVLITR